MAEQAAPIFDPAAFRLDAKAAALIDRAQTLAAEQFAPRAAQHDRDATFPTENFRDLHAAGLLAICIPHGAWRTRRRLPHLCLAAAELGRHCGATALSWNMHVCSTLWTGALADDLEMDAAERAEHERAPRHPLPAHRRGRRDLRAAVLRRRRGGGGCACRSAPTAKPVDGGFIVNGKKIFASLSGAADYYGVLCTERAEGEARSRRNTLYLAVPANAPGVQRDRRLGPARHARHGLAHAADSTTCSCRAGRSADAARRLFPGRDVAGRTCS